MSAVNYAINLVKQVIPSAVLERSFSTVPGFTCTFNPTSIEDQIRSTILYGRVFTDMNVVGGLERFLAVSDGQKLYEDDFGVSYFYDTDDLHGAEIIAVHYYSSYLASNGILVRSGGVNSSNRSMCDDKDVYQHLSGVVEANKPNMSSFFNNTLTKLVAKNTILASLTAKSSGFFKVILSNDPELQQLQPRSWRDFSKLLILAVKAYIYKEEIIKIDQSAIYNGVELSGIKGYITGLENSEEEYQEQLTKWMKISFMNDRPAYARYIASQTRGRR